jgi:hypothetical protein
MDFHVPHNDYYLYPVIFLGRGIVGKRLATDMVAIVISIQCSLIITLLIAILEKRPKKK